jgi:tetratricopeptide (TPR) repeat protein
VWQKKVPRPIAAVVSNIGAAAICDIGFGPDLRSSLLVFRQDGSTAVNQVIEANLMSCAITPDGDFALFNSLASPNHEHSVKLFAYSLPSGERAFTVDFLIQVLAGAVVDGDKVTVIAEGITYQYLRSGALLNKFETNIALFDRMMAAGYFASAHRTLNDSTKEELQSEQRRRLRAAYERLIASDITLDIKAKARRDIGELCLADRDHMQALREFREALKLNPKIGLKRKLANIEKSTGADR